MRDPAPDPWNIKDDATVRAAKQTAVLLAALLLPTLVATFLDERTLNGVNVWAKPLKFQFSFALHWLTMALLLPCLDAAIRARAATRIGVQLGGWAAVLEVLYITLQAARGRHSHFNFVTPLETVLYYGLMGGAAVLMMAVTLWLGVLIWRHPARGERGGLWLGAALGLALGSAVTLLVTAPLASGRFVGSGHWLNGATGPGLPLFGWSMSGGDMRVPHFFAVHLIQLLPLAGWLGERCWPARARAGVVLMLLAGLATTAALVVGAVKGQPFIGR